jgi:hypothetical protein
MKPIVLFLLSAIFFFSSCNNNSASSGNANNYDDDVLKSVIVNADTLKTFEFVNARVEEIKNALQQSTPVLLCGDSLNNSLPQRNICRFSRQRK